MSARVVWTGICVAAVALSLAAPRAEAAFWITPDPVVAGQPSRAVFSTAASGGVPEVEVQVDGDRIVFYQTNLCAEELCFGTIIPAFAEAALPPLEPGTYTVELVWEGGYPEPTEAATIEVQAGGAIRVLPAEGFWAPVGQPGSGLFLERRGEVLAVSAYSYDVEGRPIWTLGTGTYGGASAPMHMRGFLGGDCLGCADYQAPGLGGASGLQLRFESARRAWADTLDISRSGTVPVVSMPFGVDYVPHALTDSVDGEFGPLPLPDLSGRWLFAIEGDDAPIEPVEVRIDGWTLDGEVLRFDSVVDIACTSASDDQRAGCRFSPGLLFSPPPPEPLETFYDSGWFALLGDIEEDRIRGSFEADGQTWRVQGYRTEAPPAQ